jgi:hypothetical protein
LGTCSCEKAQGEIKKHKDIAKNLDSKLQQGGDGDCAAQLRIDELQQIDSAPMYITTATTQSQKNRPTQVLCIFFP